MLTFPVTATLVNVTLKSGSRQFTIFTASDGSNDIHPFSAFVNLKDTTPGACPVTKPELLTVAIAGLVLSQNPPETGDS